MKVERAFIQRAVELGDLAALRMALYQCSGDPVLAQLGPVAKLGPEQRQQLTERCLWLTEQLSDDCHEVPDDAELRRLMELAQGESVSDADFDVRKMLLAFDDYPCMWTWPKRRNSVPGDFTVAIIGAGFSGICMGTASSTFEFSFEKRFSWSEYFARGP